MEEFELPASYHRKKLKQKRELKRAQEHRELSRFYKLNSILGNTWAMFYVILGGRMTGKSYSITEYLVRQSVKKPGKVRNYWLRISETSVKAMIQNKAQRTVDPDLVNKYKMEITTKGNDVYNHKKPLMTVLPLSQFGKQKGVAYFDKDFDGEYNIVLDEFQLEQGEKRTSFDILYNFIGMCENLVRTTKSKIRVFLVGNTLEEASTILKAFNFLPESFGRFYLRSKRCVIDNLEPTEEYLKDRKGSIADILGGDSMSNYTNELTKDRKLLFKGRVTRPTAIIKFTKERKDWYTIWDGAVIKRYKNEKLPELSCIAMRPYLNNYYSLERKQSILQMYDARIFKFDTLITQSYFTDALSMLRKS